MLNFKRLFLIFFASVFFIFLTSCTRESIIRPEVPHRLYDLILFSKEGPTFAGIGSGVVFTSFFSRDNTEDGYDFSAYESEGIVTSTKEYYFTSMLDPWHLKLTFSDDALFRISCYADLIKGPHELRCDTILSIQQTIQQVLTTHYETDFLKDATLIDCDALKVGVSGMQSASWKLPDNSGVRITLRVENLDAASLQDVTDNEFVIFCEIEMEFDVL